MMKWWCSLFFVFFAACFSAAQVVNKDYLVKPGDGFTMYFITPIDGFKTRETKQKKTLEFDLTFKTNAEEATINMSFFTNQKTTVDSVLFLRADSIVYTAVKTELLFVDMIKKNKREYRISVDVPRIQAVDFFAEPKSSAGSIGICASGDCHMFTQRRKKWRKSAETVSNIFELIAENH